MRSTSEELADLQTRCEAAERRIEELERAVADARSQARREIETALTDLRLAQRIARIGNWTLDPEVDTPVWSDEIYAIFERDPALGPVPLAEYPRLHSEEDLERFQTAIAAAIDHGTPFDIELLVLLPSGNRKWVQAICEPEPAPGPAGHSLRGTIQDITVRRNAEARLAASEVRFRTLVEGAPDVVFSLDAEGRFTDVSPNWSRFVGEPAEAAIGQPFDRYMKAEDARRCRELLGALLTTGESQTTGEYRVRRGDGDWRWHYSNASPLRDGSGAIIGCVGIARDITEGKRAEEAQRAQRRMLADAERLAGVGSWVWHVTEDRWEFSDNWLAIHGCAEPFATMEELIPIAHPDDLDAIKAAMEAAVSGRAPYEIEHRIVRRDTGEVRVIRVYGEATEVVDGEVVTLNGAALDVTDLRAAEADREKLREQLAQAQKMESVGRLAGGVAHDFNNMLSVILGHVEIATLATASDAPELSHLEEIRKAGERSADLVRQLLAFARRQTVAPRRLDINETIGEMLAMLRRLIGENIELAWYPGKQLEPVRMDPAQIDQILANLVVNARDAIAGVGRIEISSRPVHQASRLSGVGWDRGVAVTVRDDGQGMDEAITEQIFEPFFTTKGVGEGTGLGLATVYGIVKQNRGSISVQSEPGAGTCFTILLPAAPPTPDEPGAAISDATVAPSGTETVLLVEDEAAIVSMGRSMLKTLGYSVLTADNPAEAVRMAKIHRNDLRLVLTDVVMPQMDGRSLASLLVEEIPTLAVLYMSGYTADVISDQGVLADGVRFLAKPFSMQELAEAVRSALDEDLR